MPPHKRKPRTPQPKPDDVKALRKKMLGYFASCRKDFTPEGWKEVGNVFDTTIGAYIALRQARGVIVWNRTGTNGEKFRRFIDGAARSVAKQVARVRPKITKPEVTAAALYVFKRFKKHCAADRYGENTGFLGTVCDAYLQSVA